MSTEDGERQVSPWLRIVSRCETPESFFNTFARFVEADAIFIATSKPKPVGERRRVVIQLADGHTMLNGEAEVVESLPDGGGPDGRSGMRLKLLSLEQRSQSVFFELMRRAGERRAVAAAAKGSEVRLPDPPPAATPLPDRLPEAPSPRETPGQTSPRTPGSSITLPANPLHDVSVDDLKGFIECTIFEESEGFEANDADVELPFVSLDSVVTPLPSRLRQRVRTGPPLPSPVGASEPPYAELPPRSVGLPMVVMVSAGTALLGVVAGAFLFRSAAPPTITSSTSTVAAAEEPAPPVQPDESSTPASVTPAPVPQRTSPAASVPPPAKPSPAGGCTATVVTVPPEVAVRWNGKALGMTPLEKAAVPCGPAEVMLERPRREPVQRHVVATAGTTTRVEATLGRPAGRLEVVTSPPGAHVTVNGTPAGRSPARAPVDAFTRVIVTATLAGHQPWQKSVYVRGKDFKVTASLTPAGGRKPAARGKAARVVPSSAPR
jgi:hypothetical protein